HRRGLPRAVRAEQADARPDGHVEVETLHRLDLPVTLLDPAEADRQLHVHTTASLPETHRSPAPMELPPLLASNRADRRGSSRPCPSTPRGRPGRRRTRSTGTSSGRFGLPSPRG